jgi:hypothetical protein
MLYAIALNKDRLQHAAVVRKHTTENPNNALSLRLFYDVLWRRATKRDRSDGMT